MDVLEIVEQRFPEYKVTSWYSTLYHSDIIMVSHEEGRKYQDDGTPNPDYSWREYPFKVNSEGIDVAALDKMLDGIETQVKIHQ